jgi:hypothetical protein
MACPHDSGGRYRDCFDATFINRVSMPPDEFQVLLNAQGAPALGTLTVIRCKRPELHHGAAGVQVNAILESTGDEALLQMTWRIDGSVEYHCPATDVRFLWRAGKFIPL